MKADFYDVKAKKKVKAEVTEFKTYGTGSRKRYAFRGKTADGRPLTIFVSEEKWKQAKAK